MRILVLFALAGCRFGFEIHDPPLIDEAPVPTRVLHVPGSKSGDDPVASCTRDIEAGDRNACAIAGDGSVWCWGQNDGVLGVDPATLPSAANPIQIAGVAGAIDVEISIAGYACALLEGGTVTCWGRNYNLLADGACCSGQLAPTEVAGLADVAKLAVGQYHLCAMKLDGTAWCWGAGNGNTGLLGAGVGGIANDWTGGIQQVRDLGAQVIDIAAGFDFSCAVLDDGGVRCWGENDAYQLGNKTMVSSAIPLSIDIADAERVAVGTGSAFACAVTSDGQMSCWGEGNAGTLGNGALSLYTPTPQAVIGLATNEPVSIAAGTEQACAVRADRSVACWGWNGAWSPLGIGSAGIHQSTPQSVLLAERVEQVDAGWGTLCAREENGAPWCWGETNQLAPARVAFPSCD